MHCLGGVADEGWTPNPRLILVVALDLALENRKA